MRKNICEKVRAFAGDRMSEVKLNIIERIMRDSVQHYNSLKYWNRRNLVIDPQCKLPRLIKYYFLYYVKRCDAFNNATTGAHIGFGAKFASTPHLPHGLYGIVISHNASIGKNATIYHQVTIGEGRNGAPQIGDNVVIGAGAKLFGNIIIGHNCQIGGGQLSPSMCLTTAL